MLVVCLGEEDGDSETVDFCDWEAALYDVMAGERDRWQVDLSERAYLPFALVADSFCCLLGPQESAQGSNVIGRRST